MAGWLKAGVIWNFVLSAALGLQRLAVQIGLDGLLPGAPRAYLSGHVGHVVRATYVGSSLAHYGPRGSCWGVGGEGGAFGW